MFEAFAFCLTFILPVVASPMPNDTANPGVEANSADTGSKASASQPPSRPGSSYVGVSKCNDYLINNNDPLSGVQRACIYKSNLLTSSGVFGAGIGAGWAQIMKNDPAQWGRGPQGYTRSYGTRYAAGMSKATAEYLTALAFREDPRPRRSKSPFWFDRIADAALSMFLDTGQAYPRPAFHHVAGALASGFTGMAFYPSSNNTFGSALKRSGMSFGGSLAYAELYEFEPDIFRILGKRFSPKSKK